MNDARKDILDDFIEQPKPTTIGKRVAAAIIDGLILTVILIVMFNLFGERYETTTTITSSSDQGSTTNEVTTSSGWQLEGWPTLAFMVCWFFLVPFNEGRSGQTIGKKIVGIKVICSNGDPVSISRSFFRHLFDGVDCFFLIGLIIAWLNLGKRIGDLVAGTYVVDGPVKLA